MKLRSIIQLGAVALGAWTVGLVAQSVPPARPDFRGEWRLVSDPKNPIAWIGSPLGQAGTITQDAATVTMTRTEPSPVDRHSFDLNGGETKWSHSGASGTVTAVFRPFWIEQALVVPTSFSRTGAASGWAAMWSFSLTTEDELIVVSTSPTLRQGPFMATSLLTYRKVR